MASWSLRWPNLDVRRHCDEADHPDLPKFKENRRPEQLPVEYGYLRDPEELSQAYGVKAVASLDSLWQQLRAKTQHFLVKCQRLLRYGLSQHLPRFEELDISFLEERNLELDPKDKTLLVLMLHQGIGSGAVPWEDWQRKQSHEHEPRADFLTLASGNVWDRHQLDRCPGVVAYRQNDLLPSVLRQAYAKRYWLGGCWWDARENHELGPRYSGLPHHSKSVYRPVADDFLHFARGVYPELRKECGEFKI